MYSVSKGGTATSYSYDMEGVRSAKTVGSTTYHFDTLSGKVMHQTGAARELWFIYDELGQPYMMISKQGSTVWEYFYLLNAQGDVVGIVNRYRQLVATYSYDPYGRITSEWVHPNDTVGEINPLRYRGYFYDFETGFYYLQSRYYDPVIGRFISADSFATTDAEGFLSCNMFAYCEGDPVNREDASGEFANWLVGAAVGAVIGGVFSAIQGEGFIAGATQGLVSGMIAGAAVDVALATVSTFGAAGILAAGVISYSGGFIGNIAGEQGKAVIQGKRFAKIDKEMIKRSNVAGIVNVGAFAFSGILGHADNGLKPIKRLGSKSKTFASEVKSNLSQVSRAHTDAASIHAAIHYAIHGTVLTSQKVRSSRRYTR